VLLLQGNTGTGANWLRPSLADELFKPVEEAMAAMTKAGQVQRTYKPPTAGP
jgi:hypothetical protein